MQVYQASQKIYIIWWMEAFFFSILLVGGASLTLPLFRAWWWGIIISTLCIFSFFMLFYLRKKLKKFSFSITDSQMIVRSGVFNTNHMIFPLGKIQFIQRRVSVLERFFQLCSVQVILAGNTVELYGLNQKTADAVMEQLEGWVALKSPPVPEEEVPCI